MNRLLAQACLLGMLMPSFALALVSKDIPKRVQQCESKISSMRSSGVNVKVLMAENQNRRCLRKILSESDYASSLARSKRAGDLHVSYSSFKTKLLQTTENIESIYYSIYCHSNTYSTCSDTSLIKAKRQANNFLKKMLMMMAKP